MGNLYNLLFCKAQLHALNSFSPLEDPMMYVGFIIAYYLYATEAYCRELQRH